ncbi:MAG: hypothetical protein ACR2L2_06340 [Acidobacteriota bacterium]
MAIDRSKRETAKETAEEFRLRFGGQLPWHSDRVEYYVNQVLPTELACSESDTSSQRLPPAAKQGGALALLVGFSPEPLLQSIRVYEPKVLVFVLNAHYGDVETGQRFYKTKVLPAVGQLFNGVSAPRICDPIILEGDADRPKDRPAEVFRVLRRQLIRCLEPDPRILDITGGKKSMVAGAFLFGAFTGIDISYVDFDEYDEEKRTPLGYTCRIGVLDNPYKLFGLREWERLRQLYESYSFGAARKLLREELLPTMQSTTGTELFDAGEIAAAGRLEKVLEVYEYWDNGDFCGARELVQTLKLNGISWPSVLEVLGRKISKDGKAECYWPRGSNTDALYKKVVELEESFYTDMEKLLAYADDELARDCRLIKHKADFRSALLRAIGLTEVLLRARFQILLQKGLIDFAAYPYTTWETLKASHKYYRAVVDSIRNCAVTWLIGALRYKDQGPEKYRKKYTEVKIQEVEPADDNHDKKMEMHLRRGDKAPWLADGIEPGMERDLRNKATHTFLFIPQPIAENAYKIAEKSLADFKENWASLLVENEVAPANTTQAKWADLLSSCEVEFLDHLTNISKEKNNASESAGG